MHKFNKKIKLNKNNQKMQESDDARAQSRLKKINPLSI